MSSRPGTSHLEDVEEDFSATVPARPDEWQIKQARKDRLHVFWEPDNFGLWTSPNATSLHKPVHNPNIDHDNGLIKDYCRQPRRTRWLQSLQPFLAFWPLHIDWTGPFSALHLIPGRVPVHMWALGAGWQLRTELIEAWQTLECKLVKLATGLLRRHVTAPYSWSEIRVSTLPYECGYQRLHPTAGAAAGAAYASRNAFITLSSFVSFTIALDMATRPTQPGTTPSWLAYAENDLHLDPAWLSEIHESFVCNFTPGFRPGAYVRYSAATYKETFSAFKAAHVPLYICWGFQPPKYMTLEDHAWRYRPCLNEATWAIDKYCARLAPMVDPPTLWYDSSAPSQHFPPQVQRSRGYPPLPAPTHHDATVIERDSPESPAPHVLGEDLDWEFGCGDPPRAGPSGFLARLAEERVKAMETEDGGAVQRRQTAESTAERDRLDMASTAPSVGAAMYVWEERGANHFSQRAIPREDWSNVWPLYRPEERHYSADYDEWNLVRTGDGFVADEEQFPEDPRAQVLPPTVATLADLALLSQEENSVATPMDQVQQLWKEQYSTAGSVSYDDDDEESDYGSDESTKKRKRKGKGKGKATATKRSGPYDNRAAAHLEQQPIPRKYNSPSVPSIRSPCIHFSDVKTLLRDKYMFLMSQPYVCHPQMHLPFTPESGAKNISKTTEPILKRFGLNATNPTTEMRNCIVDLYNYLAVNEKPQVIAPLWDFTPTRRNDIVNDNYFYYHRISCNRHVIGIRGKPLVQQWYLLVLNDARAVVELFDQRMKSMGEMVRYLIQQGIPFATGKPVRGPSRNRAIRPPRTLGYRLRVMGAFSVAVGT